jgi:hypothetical protein
MYHTERLELFIQDFITVVGNIKKEKKKKKHIYVYK